jgi:hypothetical protein
MYVPERVCISLCVSVPRLGFSEVRMCLCKGSLGCMIGGFALEEDGALEEETENMVYGVGLKSMRHGCKIIYKISWMKVLPSRGLTLSN